MSVVTSGTAQTWRERVCHRADAWDVELPRRPFALAAICGAHATLKTMLNYSVDVNLPESNGNYVIHELARFASVSRSSEVGMTETYRRLLQLLPAATCKNLLLTENSCHLRPLELAAKMATLRLYSAILQTTDVYLVKTETHGPLTHKWYDLTEYEGFGVGTRREYSPIKFLLELEQADLFSAACRALMSQAPTRQWIDAKMRISRPFLFAWFLVRISYIAAFFLFENSEFSGSHRNGTIDSLNCGNAVFEMPYWAGMTTTLYVFTLSAMILVVDVAEAAYFLLHNGRWRRWRSEGVVSGRKAALHHNFYRVCQLVFVVMAMFRSTAWLFPATKIPFMSELSRITACLLLPWTLLYFVQLLPSIGYFTVIIQTMLHDMLNFMIIFVIILVPFSYVFHMMVNYYSEQGCIEAFGSLQRSLYSTFTVILNMIDFTSYRLQSPGLVYGLHLLFVFTATLLLVNFLISLMSNSVIEINEQRDVVMLLQRLSVAMVMETRVGRLLQGYYCRRQREHFACRDGRVYVIDHCTSYDDRVQPELT